MVTASAVGLVKNLVFAGVLGVEELALYGIVVLVLQYGLYLANWGILNGLNFRLPVAYGRGEAEPEAPAQRALGALLCTTALTVTLYLGVVFAVAAEGQTRTALALAALAVSTTTVAEFFVLMLRVRRELIPLALTFLMRALLAVVLGAAAGSAFGFEGVVAAEVAAVVVVVTVAARRWLPPLRPRRPNRTEALGLVRIGVPLTVANLAVAGTYTIDRIFVAGALPGEDFGQYTFASIVVIAAFAISGILGQVVGPQVLFEHGAGLSLAGIRQRLLRITGMLAAGAVLGFAALLGLIELARNGIFQEYGAGLDLMPILYIGATFAVLNIYGVVLWAARRFILVMLTSLAGVVVALAGGILLTAGAPTLRDFAWLFVAAQATSTAAVALVTEVVLRRRHRGFEAGEDV